MSNPLHCQWPERSHFRTGRFRNDRTNGPRSGIDSANARATIVGMKRRLLFAILLAIVLALLIKYGANAAPRAGNLLLAHPPLTIGAHTAPI
ncbi:hypothetical protein [Bradyrhizobium sp.]|uniref:hypothetical protein n=1 Tax=Bradyrhizobium sp. TaxID=376 RepID=UPI003C52807F